MEFDCMSCSHPVCSMRGKATHYCGNYMMSKPYTLKLEVRGIEAQKNWLQNCSGSCDHNVDGVNHKNSNANT